MPTFEDHSTLEYRELMSQGRAVERTGQIGWCAGALSAAVMLSWGIAAKSPGLMIPVVFAVAIGFYGALRGRQQVRRIAGYVEEFHERPNGPQWFNRLHRLQDMSEYRSAGDWLTVILANAGMILAVLLAWMYASAAPRGDLMAGITTACGLMFGFHSISETVRLEQTNSRAMWRRVGGELQEVERPRSASSY